MKPLPGQLGFEGLDHADGDVDRRRDVLFSGPVGDDRPRVGGLDDLRTVYGGAFWRAWTPDTALETAVAAFRARFGVAPAVVTRGRGGVLLVGPIPAGG
jgi:hypothetical protein